MRSITFNKKGFTLIELLLATALFSFFMLVSLVAFMQINRSYNRGVTVKEVQQSARLAITNIADSISVNKESSTILTPSGSLKGYRLCVGTTKYSWNQFSSSSGDVTNETFSGTSEKYTLVSSPLNGNCAQAPKKSESTSIIDTNLQIQDLSLKEPIKNIASVKNLTIVLAPAKEKITNPGPDAKCDLSQDTEAAKQYCAVIKLETAVSAE